MDFLYEKSLTGVVSTTTPHFATIFLLVLDYTDAMRAVDQVGYDLICPISDEIFDPIEDNIIIFNGHLYD